MLIPESSFARGWFLKDSSWNPLLCLMGSVITYCIISSWHPDQTDLCCVTAETGCPTHDRNSTFQWGHLLTVNPRYSGLVGQEKMNVLRQILQLFRWSVQQTKRGLCSQPCGVKIVSSVNSAVQVILSSTWGILTCGLVAAMLTQMLKLMISPDVHGDPNLSLITSQPWNRGLNSCVYLMDDCKVMRRQMFSFVWVLSFEEDVFRSFMFITLILPLWQIIWKFSLGSKYHHMGRILDKEKITLQIIIFVIFPFPHYSSCWINENMMWTKTITLKKGKNINPRVTWSMKNHL